MSVDGGVERLVAEIPAELKALVDADARTNKDVVVAALWTEYGGHSTGALERRVEEQERRMQMIRSELEEREEELDQEREKLETFRSKLEERAGERSRYEQSLDEILDDMEESDRLKMDADFPRIRRLAEGSPYADKTPEDVMVDLRERAGEKERDIDESQWGADGP